MYEQESKTTVIDIVKLRSYSRKEKSSRFKRTKWNNIKPQRAYKHKYFNIDNY